MDKDRRDLTINFMDGSKASFAFSMEGRNAAAKQIKLEEFLKSPFVMIMGEGVLRLYPVTNIKSIELTIDTGEAEHMRLPAQLISGATRGDD